MISKLRTWLALRLHQLARWIMPTQSVQLGLAQTVVNLLTSDILEQRFKEAGTKQEAPEKAIIKGYDTK